MTSGIVSRPYAYSKISDAYEVMAETSRRGSLDINFVHKGTLSGLLRREWVARDEKHEVIMLTNRGRHHFKLMHRTRQPKKHEQVAELMSVSWQQK